MAIQTINLGTAPSGVGGDTQRAANTKVNNNFTTTSHAASRMVGTESGNVAEVTSTGVMGSGWGGTAMPALLESWDIDKPNTIKNAVYLIDSNFYNGTHGTKLPIQSHGVFFHLSANLDPSSNQGFQIYTQRLSNKNSPALYYRTFDNLSAGPWVKVYTDKNTTKEDNTGYLIASSPVLKVQHNSFEKVHEAEQLDVDVQHLATGVYAITGTTGLRDNDGWNLKPPKDINGNVLCICEATQDGDVITLKTYKKKFDFETVSIVADYEQPTDIPDGAEVMLRFNDLEVTNEPIE